MCGEPCPRECRICNKDIVEDIFFGTEGEPNARFVFLPDCGHISKYSFDFFKKKLFLINL
jgi:hypothetical protein